jgi:hypothetical protein
MPQSTNDRAAELHSLAAHARAHAAAATAHGKGDLTAHELSKQEHEHSLNADKLAEELGTKAARPSKAKGGMPELRADLNPSHK